MRFALIGQPNCGKSTLFNQVAGYKAETGNFSGTTVTFTESKVRVMGEVVTIVDLPGTYTLAGMNPAECVALNYLTIQPVDVIINVIDASHMVQGLSLTFELMEIGRPVVVALNMMDEAARMGLKIDGLKLQEMLGIPVLPLIASKGRGVKQLFTQAHAAAKAGIAPKRITYSADLEAAIHSAAAGIDGQFAPLNAELVAIKLLESTSQVVEEAPQESARTAATGERQATGNCRAARPAAGVARQRGAPPASDAAHGQRWFIRASVTSPCATGWMTLLLHPILGYIGLVAILFIFFEAVYGFGRLIEAPLTALLDALTTFVLGYVTSGTLLYQIVLGLMQGISGGVAIVLPYLAPFLVGMGILEDIGYLPRVAFLMDALMHKMGLHGKAVVPFILGFGCNVPAVMSTRILEDKRDRYIAAALSTMVPCAARLAVVFGLVAFYVGPVIALAIYLFNLFVIAVTGKLLTKFMPEDSPGLILEMPVYRIPTLRTVVQKSWFRVREFIIEAWPVLIVGSVVLALLSFFSLTQYINVVVSPITWILGLPSPVGVPLIFGVLRKELSLIMLGQALGSTNFSTVLTPVQMITFSVFVVFYIPCLATLSVLRRELGTREMLSIAALTVCVALVAALVARGLGIVILPIFGI